MTIGRYYRPILISVVPYLEAQSDGHEVELVGAVGEALLERVHPVGLPLGQRQRHLGFLDALDGETAELAVHLAAAVGAAARGRDGGRADALVVLGRVLPDQLVGVRLKMKLPLRAI